MFFEGIGPVDPQDQALGARGPEPRLLLENGLARRELAELRRIDGDRPLLDPHRPAVTRMSDASQSTWASTKSSQQRMKFTRQRPV